MNSFLACHAAEVKPLLAAQARTARGNLEAVMDGVGWPWSLRVSRWVDLLVVIEEEDF